MKNNKETNDELIKLRQIKWRTNISRLQDEFSELISDDNVFEKHFGERYVDILANRYRAITQTIIKLVVVYTIVMLSLFASQNSSESDFVFFGYGFKNLANHKELLLFIAAIILPLATVLSAYKNYIDALINGCLYKLTPDVKIRKFYSKKFLDQYLDSLINISVGPSSYQHFFSNFIELVFSLVAIF